MTDVIAGAAMLLVAGVALVVVLSAPGFVARTPREANHRDRREARGCDCLCLNVHH